MTRDGTELRSKWTGEDHLSQEGAHQLAVAIHDYWAEKGYVVATRFTLTPHSTRPVVCVRSDLVDGLPKDFRREDFWKILADMRQVWPRPRRASAATGAI